LKKRIFTLLVALVVLIMIGAILGALLSFYTGHTSELPKYNGLEYLIFCAKIGALGALIFGFIPSIFITVIRKRKKVV